MSFVVCVAFTIEKQRQGAFLDLVKDNARISLEGEEGCLRFDVCANPDNQSEVFLYEIYTSADAFQTHLETAHFMKFDADVAAMVVDKQVSTYELVN